MLYLDAEKLIYKCAYIFNQLYRWCLKTAFSGWVFFFNNSYCSCLVEQSICMFQFYWLVCNRTLAREAPELRSESSQIRKALWKSAFMTEFFKKCSCCIDIWMGKSNDLTLIPSFITGLEMPLCCSGLCLCLVFETVSFSVSLAVLKLMGFLPSSKYLD